MNPRDALNIARALARPRTAKGLTLPSLSRSLPVAPVDQARLAAFRRVTSYPDDGRLPITYPQVLAFPAQFALLSDPRCPVPIGGIIHVSMKIRQARPISGGEPIGLATELANGRDTARGFEFDMVTRVTAKDEVVWEGTAGILVRGATGAGSSAKSKSAPPPAETVPVGAKDQAWHVSPKLIREYARVSRDVNPIHLSAITAKLFGMPRIVAHGMWSLSRIAGLALDCLGDEHLRLDCSFKLPLFVPGGALARVAPAPSGLALKLFDKDGVKPHLVATLIKE